MHHEHARLNRAIGHKMQSDAKAILRSQRRQPGDQWRLNDEWQSSLNWLERSRQT